MIYDLRIKYLLKPWTSSHKKMHINKNPKTTTFPELHLLYSANKEPQKNNDKHLRTLRATKDTPKNKPNNPPQKKTNKPNKPPRKKKAKPNCSHLFSSGCALLKTCQLQVSGSESNCREAFPSLSLLLWVIPPPRGVVVFSAPKGRAMIPMMAGFFCTWSFFCWDG